MIRNAGTLTRKPNAEAILAQLRGVGPQTIAEIREDLRLTKRDADDAIWLLASTGRIEYDYPSTSPLRYRSAA